MNTLIVVPTFNGDNFIQDLVLSAKDIKYPFRFVNTETGGRDTGALLTCYEENPNFDSYFLLHDSMKIKKINFLEDFQKKIKNGVHSVGWLRFPIDTCGLEKQCRSMFGGLNEYPYGMAGSVQLITRRAIQILKEKDLLPNPSNSHQEAQINERLWPLVINHSGLKIDFIDSWDQSKIFDDGYEHFTKIYGGRQ